MAEAPLERFNLNVQLPSGDVCIPVDALSTPGHLKENLKYSLKVVPKYIRLTCNGKLLDDMKPLNGEVNNLKEGSVVKAEIDENLPEELKAAQEKQKAEAPEAPVMIKKEEPPKPKKPKKDVVRPVLTDKDVVKKDVLNKGKKTWACNEKYLEGKSAKRHLAYFKVEAVDDKKSYPEQDNSFMIVALGDPHTSPVWTEAAKQLNIGEKAVFAMNPKAVDYDPEGLVPTDSTATWVVELCKVADVEDICEDFSQLLLVEDKGKSERAEELDRVAVHWRMRRWMAEGTFCVASSRERMAILPGYGIVPIEDTNAPPVAVSVGEGQQEAVELIAAKIGPGGKGNLFLKTEALKRNRPGGCVVIDVELVGFDSCRGPGTEGWHGWKSIVQERELGDQWLEEADGRRKQLETFGTLQKSTAQSADAEQHVAGEVHRMAANATRRYRRLVKWLEKDDQESPQIQSETATVKMRLAKAEALSHMRFGENPGDPTEAEKKSLVEAQNLLGQVLKGAEEKKNEKLQYECLKMTLQVCIQAEDVGEAHKVLDRLKSMRPDDEELKNDTARLNRLQSAVDLKQGANDLEGVQKELQKAVEAKDGAKCQELLTQLDEMFKNNEVKYDDVKKLKVGKDVGNAMKMGDPDVAAKARKVVGGIQALAQRQDLGI